MRPRLASLALLLLALCRPASAGDAVAWGDAIYTADSALTLDATAKDAQLKKILVDPSKYAALAPIMGNTLHALMLKEAGTFDALPEYYKKALVNGVLCEYADPDIKKKIAIAQYGVEKVLIDETEYSKEEALAKALTPSIDCTVKKTASICFCVRKQPLLYCLAETIEGISAAKGPCRKEAVAELARKGKGALGPAIEAKTRIAKPKSATPEEKLKALTDPASLAGVHCDAIDPTVTPSVEKLYAADALYWTVDSPKFVANKGEANLEKACANTQLKAVHKCWCEMKVGALSCQGAVFGKIFKDSGFLDCAASPAKFDETKKAAALAAIAKMAKEEVASTPAPGPTGGNGTTTAAPSDGAATSSLPLAPLAAAAAALLLLL